MQVDFIITFNTTNYAIKAEQCLLADDIYAGVLPLPAQIRAGCGICLRINQVDIVRAITILKDNSFLEIELYTREIENSDYCYSKVSVEKDY